MKILTLKNEEVTDFGGINKTIVELNTQLSERGHDCTVITTNTSNLPEEEIYNGFRIVRLDPGLERFFYGLNIGAFDYMKKHLEELDPDVVHVHGYHGLFSPLMVKAIRDQDPGIPIVFTAHYDPLNRNTMAGKLFGDLYNMFIGKKLLKIVDHVVSISDFEARNIKKIYNPDITVIPHGVDCKTPKENKKDGTLKLLYTGYLLEYKGVQHILRAVEKLVKDEGVENVKLTVVGEGDFRENLMKLSSDLDLEGFIDWKPFLPHDQVLEEMGRHDIFIILSRTEGYGIVVAEALSRGTPTIVTNGTALEEFTKEKGCFGVDYPPKPEEVADLILMIHEDDVTVGPFTDKIRTWKEVAEDYERSYMSLTRPLITTPRTGGKHRNSFRC